MAVPNCDPRTGGGCLKFIAKKFFSYIVGYFQLVIWVIGFFTVVFSPSSVSNVVEDIDTTSLVLAGFVTLFCVLFSVVLLLGLHKDRRLFVKAYCIYTVVYLVLMAVSIVVNIFVQPKRMGFRGFFSMVLSILINLAFCFVVRCYYLVRYCNGSNQRVSNDINKA